MSRNISFRAVAGLALVAIISAACAAGTGTSPRRSPGTDGLVLRIDTHGGLLSPPVALTHIPQFSLYQDGLVVMEGAQIEIYPGSAIPPVFSMKVDAEGMRTILEAARRAGLDGPDRTYDHPAVMDAGTTTFTFVDNGVRHVISAVALGTEPNPAIPKDEQKARAKLFDLQTRLGNLRAWLPQGSVSAERPFDYQALAVVVTSEPPGERPEQLELEWPLDQPIAGLAEPIAGQSSLSCFVVDGQDLVKLRPLVARANELTPWKSGAKNYWLRFRPLLPDESGCPSI